MLSKNFPNFRKSKREKKNKLKLRIIVCIQARMASTRLKKKALRKILGRTLIEHIFRRLKACREIDGIILATSLNKENDVLARHAKDIDLKYYRGSENDMISRLYRAAKKFKADALVRITGDCPLVDPGLVDKMVKIYRRKAKEIDLVTNTFPPTFPDGSDIEVLPTATLKRLDREVKNPLSREWLTCHIMENPDKFRIYNLENSVDLSSMRWTIDYPEDLVFVREVFKALDKENKIFIMADILNFLKKNSKISKINTKRADKVVVNGIRSGIYHKLKNKKSKMANYFLKGEKIFLYPIEIKKLPKLARLIAKWVNDEVVTYFMFTGQKPQNSEQVAADFKKQLEEKNNVIFLIVDSETKKSIGYAGLYDIHLTARKAEFRILIGEKDFWGRGYGTEVTGLVTYYGFDRLNLNRIYLGYTADNKGAEKTYEKVGYVYEGTLREDIYRNSRYYDSIRMAILRKDYYKKFYKSHSERFKQVSLKKNGKIQSSSNWLR